MHPRERNSLWAAEEENHYVHATDCTFCQRPREFLLIFKRGDGHSSGSKLSPPNTPSEKGRFSFRNGPACGMSLFLVCLCIFSSSFSSVSLFVLFIYSLQPPATVPMATSLSLSLSASLTERGREDNLVEFVISSSQVHFVSFRD